MENTLCNFISFLFNKGVISNPEFFKKQYYNNDKNSTDFDEKYLTKFLANYLYHSKKTNLTNIQFSAHKDVLNKERLFSYYIKNDDFYLIKLFKRIIFINNKYKRVVVQKYFFKWSIYSLFNNKHTIKSIINKNQNGNNNSNIDCGKLTNYNYISNGNNDAFKNNINSNNNSFIMNKSNELYVSNLNNSNIINNNCILDSKNKINGEQITIDKNKENKDNLIKVNNNNLIFEKLYQDRVLRNIKYQNQIKEYNVKDMKECTFKPITNNSKSNNFKRSKSSNYLDKYNNKDTQLSRNTDTYVNIYEKMSKYIEIRNKKIEDLNYKKQNELKDIYTFIPCTNKTKYINSILINDNFEDRQLKYEAKKAENHNRILKSIENNPNTTFKPKINTNICNKSNTDCQFKRSKSNDLKKYHLERNNKINILRNRINEENGVSFKPKLITNDINNKLVNNKGKSVYKRNKEYLLKKNEKLRMIKSYDDFECTFTPKIINNFNSNKYDKLNAESGNNLSCNNILKDNVFNSLNAGNRLHCYKELYKQKINILKSNNNSAEEFSYKPHINKNTNILLIRKYKKEIEKNKSLMKYDNTQTNNNIDEIIMLSNNTKYKKNNLLNKYLIDNNENTIKEEDENILKTKEVFKEKGNLMIYNNNSPIKSTDNNEINLHNINKSNVFNQDKHDDNINFANNRKLDIENIQKIPDKNKFNNNNFVNSNNKDTEVKLNTNTDIYNIQNHTNQSNSIISDYYNQNNNLNICMKDNKCNNNKLSNINNKLNYLNSSNRYIMNNNINIAHKPGMSKFLKSNIAK